MKFVIGPDQVYFSFLWSFHIEILNIVDIRDKEHLELLNLEFLPFGGFLILAAWITVNDLVIHPVDSSSMSW
jgi:hypothetical protein